jgi:hypothetical protein
MRKSVICGGLGIYPDKATARAFERAEREEQQKPEAAGDWRGCSRQRFLPSPLGTTTTRSAVDVGSDALVRAGIADVVRRPIASAELAAALSRCLRSAATLQM